ncbi:hypothetical protein LK542_21860 [Massilia sp. IC2-477]|uniref:hypothetical protein n=1 Tax=Massilia sp. IC2-477 TaxID=2887198 RepID=UPI001D11962D|nr:hypothetical protein [Massilia sp. IC2-477]MCC2958269.1 hypothetical protein [Massilia sp. IC2-477]
MSRFFVVPRSYSPAKLAAFAALSFALAAGTWAPALDHSAGIPLVSELREARGPLASITPHRYGIKFRLYGRAEIFDYPTKAKGYDLVKSALTTAENKEIALLFNPEPRMSRFRSEAYYDVWQLSVDDRPVRTVADSKEGYRSDNAVASWLLVCFLLSGIYFSVLTGRIWHLKRSTPSA